jgi:hypothetical protein
MENQTKKFLHITSGVVNMTDAFGISEDRYNTIHNLINAIVNGEIEELRFEQQLPDGRTERGLDIAQTIDYIQTQCQSPEEIVLGAFFFGSDMGQLIQQMRDQERKKSEGSIIREAIMKAARESGAEITDLGGDDDLGAMAIAIPLGKPKAEAAQENVGE